MALRRRSEPAPDGPALPTGIKQSIFRKCVKTKFAGRASATIVSPHRPENAPSSDVFGHNRKRRSLHENAGGYLDSGAAHDLRSSPLRPDFDQRSACDATCELNWLLGDKNHAFGGSILETNQCAGRRCGIPDRIPGFRSRDFQFPVHALRRRVTGRSFRSLQL